MPFDSPLSAYRHALEQDGFVAPRRARLFANAPGITRSPASSSRSKTLA